ncbi:hypothetical protein HID58_001442 [Brassica napus]|uniref:Uncharacterized protein n=1 Tax=Brassica napus TaxID=3708 RepID=A0ABQ7X6X6_BRANA|nr:hypothetical protein HID58_095200 [Brassica napus]KAH0941805.1 hypothetical protein HID58_001442 [Brassica napus]
MHPNLKHLSPNTSFRTELLNRRVIMLLNSPTQPLREGQHLILLLRRELRSKPLSPCSAAAARIRRILLVPRGRRRLLRWQPQAAHLRASSEPSSPEGMNSQQPSTAWPPMLTA